MNADFFFVSPSVAAPVDDEEEEEDVAESLPALNLSKLKRSPLPANLSAKKARGTDDEAELSDDNASESSDESTDDENYREGFDSTPLALARSHSSDTPDANPTLLKKRSFKARLGCASP